MLTTLVIIKSNLIVQYLWCLHPSSIDKHYFMVLEWLEWLLFVFQPIHNMF